MSLSEELERRAGRVFCSKSKIGVGVVEDLESYLYELWPEGRVLALATADCAGWLRDERVAELKRVGLQIELKIFEGARDYKEFVQEALADGSAQGVCALVSLGDFALFEACKEMALILGIPCGVCLDGLPQASLFVAKDAGEFSLALFMVELRGVVSEQSETLAKALYCLEGVVHVSLIDEILNRACGGQGSKRAARCWTEALASVQGQEDLILSAQEDGLVALVEAYAWYSAGKTYFSQNNSIDAVLSYVAESQSLAPVSALALIVWCSQHLTQLLELDELQIDVDALVQRRLPKEIHERRSQQRMLEDGVALHRGSAIALQYEDRTSLRARLSALRATWEDVFEHLQSSAASLQGLCVQIEDLRLNEMILPRVALEELCLHAADFAPPSTLVALLSSMQLLDEE